MVVAYKTPGHKTPEVLVKLLRNSTGKLTAQTPSQAFAYLG